jgi:hypothetical protein
MSHAILLTALTAACGVRPTPGPVPVEGPRAELDALSGEWDGEYWTADSGRHGTVRFRLRPGVDTAYGEVEMTFSRALRLYGDPDCDCRTLTVFEGNLAGDRVQGSFTSQAEPETPPRLTGRWFAERTRNP